jgi:hypothetical protein
MVTTLFVGRMFLAGMRLFPSPNGYLFWNAISGQDWIATIRHSFVACANPTATAFGPFRGYALSCVTLNEAIGVTPAKAKSDMRNDRHNLHLRPVYLLGNRTLLCDPLHGLRLRSRRHKPFAFVRCNALMRLFVKR